MNSLVIIKPDRRFKPGKIKRTGNEFRGHPDTMKMKLMDVSMAPPEVALRPPIVITSDLANSIKGQF